MIEAGYLGVCLGVHFWPLNCEAAWREMNKQIDIVDEIAAKTEGCVRVRSAQDWEKVQQSGKLGLAVGVEGAHMLNGRLERVELARVGEAHAHARDRALAAEGGACGVEIGPDLRLV